jgi:tetratricopeptide (TPR) repeat protein
MKSSASQFSAVGIEMPAVADEKATPPIRMKPRRRLVIFVALAAGASVWCAWKCWEDRRYRSAMAEIAKEIEAGRYGLAARNLGTLNEWKPGSDEGAYLLGACEKARNRTDAAFQAWARVPPGSPFSTRAIQGRMDLHLERGRLADAEQLIDEILEDPRIDRFAPSLALRSVYNMEGRVDEAERLIEACWDDLDKKGEGASEKGVRLVRLNIDHATNTASVEAIRLFLEQAAQSAPDDDRVWLGRANLAIRAGTYDEAVRWLDACLRRRPDDVPVWRARLNWAMAVGRVDQARTALKHLPAAESTPAEVQKLAAWFAWRRGDVDSERRALERLTVEVPADFTALERLIELTAKDGQMKRAAELRSEKTKVEQRQARYQKLHRRYQPSRDAAEMARLAEQLGRWFEAKVYLTVAASEGPDRVDHRSDRARLTRHSRNTDQPGRALAGLLDLDVDSDMNSSNASPSKREFDDGG